jgi:dihydrofolate synthase / folylpolyglutamate synthase
MVYLPHWPIPSTIGKKTIDYETVFERAKIVLERLENPHLKLPPVIHIAGTNGKGSTASLIAKIFQCHGYKAHLYTSPHLHDCNERILIDGQKISDRELYATMEEVRLKAQDVDLTFMEAFTIGAFLAFSKNPADVVVVECGMGGRIDITNIISQKIATVLTSISMDHVEYLGDTIQKITLEKVQIIRPQIPLIVGPQAHIVRDLIKIIANDQQALSYFYDEDFSVEKSENDGTFDFFWQNEILLPNLRKPNLEGDHQYYNFACAIACCMAISSKFNFNYDGINQAVSSVKWQSRLEKINNNLNKILKNLHSEIWIDGAHNEGGAFILANWIRSQSNIKNYVICGFSRGKCKVEFLEKFKDIAEIFAVRVDGEPYPESSENIITVATKNGIHVNNGENLLNAINLIENKSLNEPYRIIICGSLHLARDVRNLNKQILK